MNRLSGGPQKVARPHAAVAGGQNRTGWILLRGATYWFGAAAEVIDQVLRASIQSLALETENRLLGSLTAFVRDAPWSR